MGAQRPAYWRYGGQAVIEGVMMRSPRHFAVACRKPDGGMIVHAEPIENAMRETQESFTPVGAVAFFVAMILVYALVWLTTYGVLLKWR